MVVDSYLVHAVADSAYYDLPGESSDRTSFPVVHRPVPDGWRRAGHGLWVHFFPVDSVLPAQGWKIHVSASAPQTSRIVELVSAFCFTWGIVFKVLCSEQVAGLVNSKSFPRKSSGKLVTLYPDGCHDLERILDELDRLLAGCSGPDILGDLRCGESPVFVRYGSFVEQYCTDLRGVRTTAVMDNDGRLVPDVRGVVFKPPSWVPVPDFIARRREEGARQDRGFPYVVESALHFSNAGGVYTATDSGGRRVVLKEARPHAGVDLAGRDAVARLRAEYAVLRELAELEFVPAAYCLSRWWEHEFLAQEWIEGTTLADWAASAPREPAAILDVLDEVERMLADLHRHGWVFGDLQPCNIMRRVDGRLVLIDFEAAFRVGQRRSGLGTPGFCAPAGIEGFAVDHYSMACLRLHFFLPLTSVLSFDSSKAAQLVMTAAGRFSLPDTSRQSILTGLGASGARPEPGGDAIGDIAAAILASATPGRSDRLFPGDPAQFRFGALGLAYGAAGVLYALSAAGVPPPEEHLDWLAAKAIAATAPRTGLYDGLHGVAWLLFHAGRREAAVNVLDRALSARQDTESTALFDGTAGIIMNLLLFAGELGDSSLRALAVRLAGPLTEVAQDVPAPGLMYGRAGHAVALAALYESTGDASWLAAARRDLNHDIGRLRGCSIATGAAGVALAAQRLRPSWPAAPLAELVPMLAPKVLGSAGLFTGQAGLLAGATAAAAGQLPEHRENLLLHALSHGGGQGFLGHGQLRLSMDLATGSAGALLALCARPRLPVI